jgi:hypothetical protein
MMMMVMMNDLIDDIDKFRAGGHNCYVLLPWMSPMRNQSRSAVLALHVSFPPAYTAFT